jgi:hypothetical protein
MNLNEIKEYSQLLQNEADELVRYLNLDEVLSQLGSVRRVGSSTTGLLLNEDIDFKVYTDKPSIQLASDLATKLLNSETSPVIKIEIMNFDKAPKGHFKLSGIYIGLSVLTTRRWNIDIVIMPESKIPPHEKEMDALMQSMSPSQQDTILELKAELIELQRHGGLPKHPYIFTSCDIYKAVLDGGIKNIEQLEKYWS